VDIWGGTITLLIILNLPPICSKDVLKKQDFEDVENNLPY